VFITVVNIKNFFLFPALASKMVSCGSVKWAHTLVQDKSVLVAVPTLLTHFLPQFALLMYGSDAHASIYATMVINLPDGMQSPPTVARRRIRLTYPMACNDHPPWHGGALDYSGP
jgi:cytosine/uracil/thiamine/allantoin permease